uniref:Protein kinase domain-containing protein n=1 Tax=Ganoderma boninense TaxID=34458 RepID=A0A5K1JXC6_9APHY|nr:Protein kinase domain-containing protein [Ganoderma boninense]
MSSSDNVVTLDNWRKELYTFADEAKRVFTVTNCPPIIHPIATTADSDFIASRSFGSLLRPQMSVNNFPELPFLLRKLPVADPLLSRLCVDPSSTAPIHYKSGWALADDLRNSWTSLEKGLVHISELLLTSTRESPVGSSAWDAIRHQEHWPLPEDYGYRKPHASSREARTSIRHAHGAFQILAARCSLAIALWQFPGPIKGHIPSVSTLRYDSVTATVVPDWILFLRRSSVPSSWIDAISDSVLTDFSINLRVGTVFDAIDCPWLPIISVLSAANVPVFVLWHDRHAIDECLAARAYMKPFSPVSGDATFAINNLPGGKPRVVALCRGSQLRPLPDYFTVDNSVAPFGPYQLPNESRLEFFERRSRYRADQERQETLDQKQRRHLREAHAKTGDPPYRRSRVYLWVKPELVFPDVQSRWADHEYRHPLPPPAYRSVWMVHPASSRQYNSFYDEWDLWFPENWDPTQDEPLAPAWELATTTHSPHATFAASTPLRSALLDEHELLNPTPEDREIHDVGHPDNFVLQFWYGIRLADTREFSGVDYQHWEQHDIWHLFGEIRDRFPADEASLRCLSGWVSAVMQRNWKSRALETTWDLDPRHPNYLLGCGNPDPRLSVSLNNLRSPERQDDCDDTLHWVLVKFKRDPEDQPWSLLTSPMGALLLIRRLSEQDTSYDALYTLLCAGIPVRTGKWFPQSPAQVSLSKPPFFRRRLGAPWRKKGERPTVQDYDAYCQRVLELSHSPHARAAWLKGGIVWRIMVEVTGKHPQADLSVTHLEELQKGPSGLTDHYQAVTLNSQQQGYYDDALSRAELDLIAGVVRVYTGRGDQTEDASWWPKHSAWVRAAGNTGIWSSSDERWFQCRLRNIFEEKEGPLNAGEWKVKLKRQKKAGTLADVVAQRAWDFTYRNFVQHPVLS